MMNAITAALDAGKAWNVQEARARSVNRRPGFQLRGWTQSSVSIRNRVLAAFRDIGHGVNENTAFALTKDFYRRSGNAWTRNLT